jgi:hypothetical protein
MLLRPDELRWVAGALVVLLTSVPTVHAQLTVQTGAGPRFSFRPGETYFRVDGTPAFLLGRNPAGRNAATYDDHFRHAAAAGERLVRIHFTYSPPQEKAGAVDPGVLRGWDAVLDAAEAHGLGVLPVFGVWADWNDGSRGETWHAWSKNPFSTSREGPAVRPVELFEDTAARRLWLGRLDTLVRHWAARRPIVAWEVFSELDLVTGATEELALGLTERAAAVIRTADPWKRPVTASQAGTNEWPKLLASLALDFIEVHPYAGGPAGGRLDELILRAVRHRRATYRKPVLLGECGLDAAPPHGTLDTAARARIGIRHAIWAALVSGAMNGRMLWWQDGYDQFENADLCRHYQETAASAAAFVRGVDFSGFAPVTCEVSDRLFGAMLGNDRERLGWFRDTRSIAPDWPETTVTGAEVTLEVPGTSWRVEFVDPATGVKTGPRVRTPNDRRLRLDLPPFQGDVAIRLQRLSP